MSDPNTRTQLETEEGLVVRIVTRQSQVDTAKALRECEANDISNHLIQHEWLVRSLQGVLEHRFLVEVLCDSNRMLNEKLRRLSPLPGPIVADIGPGLSFVIEGDDSLGPDELQLIHTRDKEA